MKLLTAIAAVAALIATPTLAAPISWQTPVAITSADQALNLGGTIEYAVAWTGNGPVSVTLDDSSVVNFQSGTIDGSGQIQVSGAYGICGTNCAEYYGTSNSAFNAAMGGFAYDGQQVATLTDLVIGTQYSIQLFSIDNRGCCGHQTQYWDDLTGNASVGYAHNADVYIIGSFVADAITQSFRGYTNTSFQCSAAQCTNLNAAVLRSQAAEVPEPAMLGLFGLGLVSLGLRRRTI